MFERSFRSTFRELVQAKKPHKLLKDTMAISQPCAKLFTGATLPLIGLGTWKSKAGEVTNAVKVAIAAGYRHIDCAYAYGNETEVGVGLKEALAANGLKREDVFITSKLWNTKHRPEDVKPAVLKTLKDLQLDYVDLYLIHWPMAFQPGEVTMPKNPDGSITYGDTHFLDTYAAMETLVDEGLVKHIGLSNFNSKQIDEVMAKARVQPAALQCECHPYLTQKELIAHAVKYNIVFEAYSPLGSPDRPWAKPGEPSLLEDPKIVDIGKKYGKTAAQVLIRFQVERGVSVLPKSVTPDRIRANFDILDFKLTSEDMAVLESFNRNWRACLPKINVGGVDVARDRNNPFFPFGIPY